MHCPERARWHRETALSLLCRSTKAAVLRKLKPRGLLDQFCARPLSTRPRPRLQAIEPQWPAAVTCALQQGRRALRARLSTGRLPRMHACRSMQVRTPRSRVAIPPAATARRGLALKRAVPASRIRPGCVRAVRKRLGPPAPWFRLCFLSHLRGSCGHHRRRSDASPARATVQ